MALTAPGRYNMPAAMKYAQMLYETGWPPDVFYEQPLEDVQRFLLYRNVAMVRQFGGELTWPKKPA